MTKDHLEVPVMYNGKETSVVLYIYPETSKVKLFEDDSKGLSMSRYQLQEGSDYAYEFLDTKGRKCQFQSEDELIRFSKLRNHANEGTISTGIYVGHLSLQVCLENSTEVFGTVDLEIRSVKSDYETDYRQMLEDIAGYYTDLVLQQGAPVTQQLEVDNDTSAQTLYQRFSFVRSIIESTSFSEAIHKIISNPVRKWKDTVVRKNILGVKRLTRRNIRQIASARDRIPLPERYQADLPEGMESVPRMLDVAYKEDTVDNPENQFIKFVLRTFVQFCSDLASKENASLRLKKEANQTIETLYTFLDNQFFRQVSSPTHLNMNSPVLQRKEGYREVFQDWLLFDLAAKLNWSGGDSVYDAGKKNVATLYEYWLFFKLQELISEFFNIDQADKGKLVSTDKDRIDLNIRQGRMQVLRGVQQTLSRKLNIAFYYNRTFSKVQDNDIYNQKSIDSAGSWTMSMRPDYTLSLWAGDISEAEAERQNSITHIHFDAKYRVNKILLQDEVQNVDSDEPEDGEDFLSKEKKEQELGNYKRADLLKMHAYKDAIRRTSGAYVLYPGTENKVIKGFHEIVPGLGAFSIRPNHWNEDSIQLRIFLSEVKAHLLDRISEREEMSYYSYKVYRDLNPDMLMERMPEPVGENRDLIPEATSVIVGFYKDQRHLEWVLHNHLYNMRAGTDRGAMTLNNETINARYLLLHDGKVSKELINIEKGGPMVMTRHQLIELGYPRYLTGTGEIDYVRESREKDRIYFVYNLDRNNKVEKEFENCTWDMKNVIPQGYLYGKPLPVGLIDLLKCVKHRK